MKKIIAVLLLLIGSALIGSAIYSWVKPNVDQVARDIFGDATAIFQFLFGVAAEIKGLRDLFIKEKASIGKVEAGAQVSLGNSSRNIQANQYIEKVESFVVSNQPDLISALSKSPVTIKAGLDILPIGREKELNFLRDSNSDVLLIGQPGSGKTFLFYQLAKEELGLFVISKDANKILREYKDQKPKLLFIDDAQLYKDIINDLVRFRTETKSDFHILASCWPSSKDKILQALNIPENRTIVLDLLTRDEIVQVVNSVGLTHPDFLVHEIVNQAVGRPGLAVTLADMCLIGDARDVYFGEILNRTLSKFVFEEVGEKASVLLAAFAVGGNAGMSISSVSQILGLDIPEVLIAVTKLASSGILYERSAQLLAVYPPSLRDVLVRDMFFGNMPKLDIQPFIKDSPELGETCLTLIGARARGGIVPIEMLIEMLQVLNSPKIWKVFAYIGQEEATLTAKYFTGYDSEVYGAILEEAPECAIPILIENAVNDDRPLNSHPDHSLRIMEAWVENAQPGEVDAIKNRKILLEQIKRLIDREDLTRICVKTLAIVMNIDYQDLRQTPGSGNTVKIYYGSLTYDEIKELEQMWDVVKGLLLQYGSVDWETIKLIVESWAYPARHQKISKESANEMELFAEQMLKDLFPLLETKRGYLHWANHLSKSAGFSLEIGTDVTFEILYPRNILGLDVEMREKEESLQRENVRALTGKFLKQGHKKAIKDISKIENEAKLIGRAWPRWTPYLCSQIAEDCRKPLLWLQDGIERSLAHDLVMPFFIKFLASDNYDSVEVIYLLLQNEKYKNAVIYILLQNSNLPTQLLNEILADNLDFAEDIIETGCARGEFPDIVVLQLLCHKNKDVVKAAVKGVWEKDQKEISDYILYNWEQSFVASELDDYFLKDVLKDWPNLTYLWVQKHIFVPESDPINWRLADSIKAAIDYLDDEARKKVIARIDETPYARHITGLLIGTDTNLYRELLLQSKQKSLHLIPLYGTPSENWIEMARLALEFGYSHKEIAHAMRWALYEGVSWVGKESKMWSDWIDQLQPFAGLKESSIQKIINLALIEAKQKMEQALAGERKEDIFGME